MQLRHQRPMLGQTKTFIRRLLKTIFGVTLGLTILGGPVWASTWVSALVASSYVQSLALVPLPPTPSAACIAGGGKKIVVTWGAIAHATSYTVYQSTISATTGYTSVNTTTTRTYTTGNLQNHTYWYEVAETMSTHWVSANSSSTASHTIATGTCS